MKLLSCAEADKLEQINRADGEAKAILSVAESRAKSIDTIGQVLTSVVRYFVEKTVLLASSMNNIQVIQSQFLLGFGENPMNQLFEKYLRAK